MGVFTHTITIFSQEGRSETLDGLVDTGAMFTVVPTPILNRMGVRPFRTVPVKLANGSIEQRPLAQVEAEIDGQRMPIFCLFGSPEAPPLIGAHTLEAFLLMVDPIDQKLVPKEAYLM